MQTSTKEIASVAVGTGFGAPVVTALAVNGVGFTATGIVKGTLAAKMMSAAAIANGGGVASGGSVAILQSVGAAGLTMSGAIPIVVVGAAVGVGGYYGYKYVRGKL